MQKYREICCVNTSRSSQIFWKTLNWPKSAPIQLAKTVEKRTLLHDTWWHRTWQTERIISRVHLAWKWSIISTDRMDSWKHEDRSSAGCDCQLSSRTSRSWNHDRISFWLQDLHLVQAPQLLAAQTQIQISASSQCSFRNTWKWQRLSWVGFFLQMEVLALLMVTLLLDGV